MHGLDAVVRMGPLPRSLATEAHECFMVRTPDGSNRIQGCGARFARTGGLPSDCSATSAIGSAWWRWHHTSQVHCNASRDELSLARCTEAERNKARSEATSGHNNRALFPRTALSSTRTPKVKFLLTRKAPYKQLWKFLIPLCCVSPERDSVGVDRSPPISCRNTPELWDGLKGLEQVGDAP